MYLWLYISSKQLLCHIHRSFIGAQDADVGSRHKTFDAISINTMQPAVDFCLDIYLQDQRLSAID